MEVGGMFGCGDREGGSPGGWLGAVCSLGLVSRLGSHVASLDPPKSLKLKKKLLVMEEKGSLNKYRLRAYLGPAKRSVGFIQ